MSLSIQNTTNSSLISGQNTNFKGKFKDSETGHKYYHTNSAMKIGGAIAGISALSGAMGLAIENNNGKLILEACKDQPIEILNKIKTTLKNRKLGVIAGSLLAIGVHLFASSIIDNKRNKKAQEMSEFVNKLGADKAVQTRNDIGLSNKGNVYYESDIGSKLGGWLGAGAGLLFAGSGYLTSKATLDNMFKNLPEGHAKAVKNLSKSSLLIALPVVVGASALCGWLFGKWSDNIANNDARKNV